MNRRNLAICCVFWVLLPMVNCFRVAPPMTAVRSDPPAGAIVPVAGIRAEEAGEWEEALAIYDAELESDPSRSDLWLRTADIHSRLGNLDAAIAALEKAAATGGGSELYFKLAQAHSLANQAEAAFQAVDKALAREPRNPEYLRARAQLANWTGRPRLAADSYRRLHLIAPADDDALLNLARSETWSGNLDDAIRHYRRYLAGHASEKSIWLECVNAQSWRGNFAAARSLLEHYRDMFGTDESFGRALVDLLARADLPREARAHNRQALQAGPDNYQTLFSEVIALKNDNRPRAALAMIPRLEELRPGSRENRELERFVITPLRPDVRLDPYGYYWDSDDLRSSASSLEAGINLNRELRLRAGFEFGAVEAATGSPFVAGDGRSRVSWQRPWIGGTFILAPAVTLGATAAWQLISGLDGQLLGSVFARVRPSDRWRFNLSLKRDVLSVSPLSLSLGIRRDCARLGVAWEPGWRGVVEAEAVSEHYGDGNRRWEASLAPRWKLLRLAAFNLDVGLRGWWFGYERDLQNGYWDPELFRSYMALAYGYWKISDNDGISIVAGLGVVGDDTDDRMRFGSTLDVEGTLGIYRDLMLKVHAALYHNLRQASGAFRAMGLSFQIVYRF